ncbi:MAG TPA: BON domain-containing protein [Telluria sp.]|nr:BON domain-containing protein [Telluria sp.]
MSKPAMLAKTVLAAALALSLSGCVEMVLGSALVGVVAASDRRTLGAQTDDKTIAMKAEMRMPSVTKDEGHVNVNSYNRKVLLTGEVKDEAMKAAVESHVRGIAGVENVINELEVGPMSTYTSRSSDALVTTKVKASLVDMKTISANSFKVITERGTVYLMGRVTEREGQVATDVARGVAGVKKVVKLLEYITEEQLRSLQPESKRETL